MKKVGLIMKELGFNKNASHQTKEAFMKHLIKTSTGINVITPTEDQEMKSNQNNIIKLDQPEQLSFFETQASKEKAG